MVSYQRGKHGRFSLDSWSGKVEVTHLVTAVEDTSEKEDEHEDEGVEKENGGIGFSES